MFCGCVVWTFVESSSWFYSCYIWWMCCLNVCRVQFLVYPCYIWWMCCLNFCTVQFLVLLLLCLVDVLSKLLLGPVPGFTPVIFGECVVCTFIGSSSSFYSHYIWRMCFLIFVGSSSSSFSRYIWWICCLNFYRVQFLVLLPLYLVDVFSERL
jgi:hypothetical protein